VARSISRLVWFGVAARRPQALRAKYVDVRRRSSPSLINYGLGLVLLDFVQVVIQVALTNDSSLA
jgi:hypothetical protein